MAEQKESEEVTQPDAVALKDEGAEAASASKRMLPPKGPLAASATSMLRPNELLAVEEPVAGEEHTPERSRSSRPPLLKQPAPPKKARMSWFGAGKASSEDVERLMEAVRELDQQVTALEQSGLHRADRIQRLEVELEGHSKKKKNASARASERLSPGHEALRAPRAASKSTTADAGAGEPGRLAALETALAEERLRRRDIERRLGRLQLLLEETLSPMKTAVPSKRRETGSSEEAGPEIADTPTGHSQPPPDSSLRGIQGIGATFAKVLAKHGVVDADQIAGWDESAVIRHAKFLRISPARIRREKWVEQAKKHVAEG